MSRAGKYYVASNPDDMIRDLNEGTASDFGGSDVWSVDTKGLRLRDDPESPSHWGAKYTSQGIGPERLRLVRQGKAVAGAAPKSLSPGNGAGEGKLAKVSAAAPEPKPVEGTAVHDALGKPELNPDQVAALKSYGGAGYMALNHYLRADRVPGAIPRHQIDKGEAEKQSALLDSVFDQAKPLSSPAVVYRGMSGTVKPGQLKPGSEFSDKAYVSTSTDKDQADEFSYSGGKRTTPLVRIHLPAGAKAVSVANAFDEDLQAKEDMLGNPSEREVLLPRGSRFRVTGKTGKIIEAELVPDG